MSRPQILIHRTDAEIDSELEQALDAISGPTPVLHFTSSLRETTFAANDFQPVIFMVDLLEDIENVRVLVEEVIAVCPDVTVVGICAFGGNADANESALMMSALRMGVEDFVRRPISASDLSSLFDRRIDNRRVKKSSPGTLVSFVSNKGGVGKSTCAVNVAVELAARHPERVILIDGSLQMGVCAAHLNLEPIATITDAWNQRERLDSELFKQLTTVHESGLHLMAAPASAVEAAEIDDAFVSRLLLLARRNYDFVVVDTFPLFDRTIMAILDLSDLSFVVLDNVVPTLKSIRGFFELLSDVGFPEERSRVLLNRFTTKSGAPHATEVESFLGRRIDYTVPYDNKVVLATNLGQPMVASSPRWNKSVQRFKEMADAIEQEAASEPNGRSASSETLSEPSASLTLPDSSTERLEE